MFLLQCEMCCGEIEISPDKSVGVCKYCGSTFTIPKEVERKGNLFNRANYLRQNCSFDKAANVYESILAENCDDADALWGLVLCRYGIEFVEDPKTGTRIPTCHRASRTSILSDPDYKNAIAHADEEKRQVYQENATRIDQIQKAILNMSANQEKYDVFICYKESDDRGERTIDSVLAQELYNELTRMKIKTFFARKTLEGKVGSSYEPIIYSALNSARVMIVLGTKPEYFEATWVKNEWSRYLDFMKESDDKHLIPAYRDMSAYELPEEFVSIQALDMSRIGFMLDMCDGVKKLLRKDEEAENLGAMPITKENMYSRAMVFLGNREFYKAVDYFEKVLDLDPKYARAYWGSLLASYQCVTNNELINCRTDDWTEDARLKSALQFANEEEKQIYEDTLQRRVENFTKLAYAALESSEFDKCRLWCDKRLSADPNNGNVWWLKLLAIYEARNSNELYDNCLDKTATLLDTQEYHKAISCSPEEEVAIYKKAAERIDAAVTEKKRMLAYNLCRTEMNNYVRAVNGRKEQSISDLWKDRKQEDDLLRIFRLHKGKLYRNNIFSFLMSAFFWTLPCYLMAVLITDSSYELEKFPQVFGIVLGVMMALLLLIHFCTYMSRLSHTARLRRNGRNLESSLEERRKAVTRLYEREAKLLRLLKKFESDPNLPMEQIEAARKAAAAICEE